MTIRYKMVFRRYSLRTACIGIVLFCIATAIVSYAVKPLIDTRVAQNWLLENAYECEFADIHSGDNGDNASNFGPKIRLEHLCIKGVQIDERVCWVLSQIDFVRNLEFRECRLTTCSSQPGPNEIVRLAFHDCHFDGGYSGQKFFRSKIHFVIVKDCQYRTEPVTIFNLFQGACLHFCDFFVESDWESLGRIENFETVVIPVRSFEKIESRSVRGNFLLSVYDESRKEFRTFQRPVEENSFRMRDMIEMEHGQ